MVFTANFYGIVGQTVVGIDPVRAFKKNENKIIFNGFRMIVDTATGKKVYEEQT